MVTRHMTTPLHSDTRQTPEKVCHCMTVNIKASIDDGTESVCSCCCTHCCCRHKLTLIFFWSFIFSTPFPACHLVCLHGVIMRPCWTLSELMALLCVVCAHLWRVDCVMRNECDELTGSLERLVRGCRRETGSWFQREGEASRTERSYTEIDSWSFIAACW